MKLCQGYNVDLLEIIIYYAEDKSHLWSWTSIWFMWNSNCSRWRREWHM